MKSRMFLMLGLVLGPAGVAAADDAALASQARTVLAKHCHRCHGQEGTLEGGFGYVMDRDRLVSRGKIVPGKADQSPLFKRIAGGKMPPPAVKERPTGEETAVLKRWIDAGAPAGTLTRVVRNPITEASVLTLIRDDLERLEPRSRRFQRYFSLAHLANQGLSEDDLQTCRLAVAKLLNSLSWHPRIVVPKAIDPEGFVLRFDLREVMWDANLWNRLLSEYPYAVLHDTSAARSAVVGTATRVPVVRADWFIATASRPPLYYDLLQLPAAATELERQLRVDVAQNIIQERIARAGFNGSGISRNNRVLERHDSVHGAYWRTYDFDAIPQNLIERDILLPDRRNLFAYPLGPGGTDNTFQHAGGEIIFNLPNGLHGFMLVNAVNNRIDKGPIAIVSDPKRPDRAVEPGVSCMSCHVTGILQKADQVRDHVDKNPKAFPAKDADIIKALYVKPDKMKSLMDEDAERWRKALEKTGNRIGRVEPVSTWTLRFEADVDLDTAAAEIGLTTKDFHDRVLSQESVARNLGSLKGQGGVVSRQTVAQSFGDMARALRLGSVIQAGATGQNLPDNTGEVDPLEGATNQTNAVAFSRDGRRALLASADKSVRLWDVEAGRELRRFVGHSASVWSTAFNAEGTFGASGGVDTIVRIWDINAGNESKRLEGHGGLVATVTFSPDGRQLLSAALDHSVILWDLESGKEIRRLEGVKHVNAVTFSADGKQALVSAADGMHLFDLADGKRLRVFEGHKDSVVEAAFLPGGKQVVSASDDGTVRLWDVAGGRVVRSFIGHDGPVKSVCVSPDGTWVASGGSDASVRLWEAGSGKELKKFTKHSATVLGTSFTADGSATRSGSNDADVRLWTVGKGRGDAPPAVGDPVAVESPVLAGLKPERTLPLKGAIGRILLSPNGRWIHYLTPAGDGIVRIDADSYQRSPLIALALGTETAVMTPDGKTIVALAPGERQGWCRVQVIDAVKWTLVKTHSVAVNAYDIAADDRGRIYLSGGGGDWTDIAVVNATDGTVAARWGGVWTRSIVRLSNDQKRLYVSTQGVTPGSVDAFVIPSRLDDKPIVYRSPARTDRVLGGDLTTSSDGKFVLLRSGVVLRSVADSDVDLKYDATLKPFLTAVFAAGDLAFHCDDRGTMSVLSYPLMKPMGAVRLSGIGYQSAYDSARGKLYVAVFDPKVLAGRTGERGAGELQVFDVKSIAAAIKK